MTSFEFSAPIANRYTREIMTQKGDFVATGDTMAQVQMGVLVGAEELAAMAGVVPWGKLPTGEAGIVEVGKALETIHKAPLPVQVAYLGAHNAVRRTIDHVEPLTVAGIGVLPAAVVWALSVTGIAAIVATAWYAKESKDAEVRLGEKWSQDLFVANTILDGMKNELATTGKISGSAWKTLERFAESEKKETESSSLKWVLVGGVAIGAALWFFSRKSRAS